MLSTNDIVNIILPVLSHWIIWLIFLIFVIMILIIDFYPYFKRSGREFPKQQIGIPITCIISLYVFIKMLEGVLYSGAILKIDVWLNEIVFSSGITKVATFITAFGSTIVIAILFILVLGALFLKKRWRYAIFSTMALLGAIILVTIVKDIVQRTRPVNLIETGYSFPSGHAITAIVFVSLLIYSFKDDFKNRTTRYVLIILASAFFTSVGISRIILHVHWFSDVAAGISLGLFWFMLVVLVERFLYHLFHKPKSFVF